MWVYSKLGCYKIKFEKTCEKNTWIEWMCRGKNIKCRTYKDENIVQVKILRWESYVQTFKGDNIRLKD